MLVKVVKNRFKSILSFFYFLNKRSHIGEIIDNKEYSNLFFGYYDVSSFDFSEKLIALHGQKNSNELDILIYDLGNKTFKTVGTTNAWNYQQGARLMWFGKNELIYNKFDSKTKKYFSVVVNIATRKEYIIEHPLQALYKDEYLLSFSYYYLNQIGTEYGYKQEEDNDHVESLIHFDLNTCKSRNLFKIEDCFNLLTGSYPHSQSLHFNHFLISPNGKYFIFVYRFYSDGVRVDHLFGYSMDDNQLEVLIENELISHCAWRSDNEFIFWGRINNIPGYYLYKFTINSVEFKLSVSEDGHPTFLRDDIILTDTYPDHFLCQTLSLWDIQRGTQKKILKVKHPVGYSAYERCDLHPSISLSKSKFQIDINNNGKRKVCVGVL